MKNYKYIIFLYPKIKLCSPHIWIEGGIFDSVKSAEFQARQIRKTGMYKSVEVLNIIAQ